MKWKEVIIKCNGQEVKTIPVEYDHTPYPEVYYQLNDKYSKLLVKLLKLKSEESINKHILDFELEAEKIKKLIVRNTDYLNPIYIRNIDDMIQTLKKFPR